MTPPSVTTSEWRSIPAASEVKIFCAMPRASTFIAIASKGAACANSNSPLSFVTAMGSSPGTPKYCDLALPSDVLSSIPKGSTTASRIGRWSVSTTTPRSTRRGSLTLSRVFITAVGKDFAGSTFLTKIGWYSSRTMSSSK